MICKKFNFFFKLLNEINVLVYDIMNLEIFDCQIIEEKTNEIEHIV